VKFEIACLCLKSLAQGGARLFSVYLIQRIK